MTTKLFLKSSSINTVLKFTSVGVVFLFQSLLAKTISVQEYSLYAKFTMYSGYVALLLSFGMTSSILYFSKTDKEFKNNYIGALLLYISLSIAILSIAIFIFNIDILYIYIIIFSFLLNIIGISLSYYQYKNQFSKYALLAFLQSLCVFSILIIIKIFGINNMNYFFQIYLTAHILFALLLVYRIYIKNRDIIIIKVSLKFAKITYGFKTIGLVLLAQFIYISDFVMVDYYLEDTQLTYYFVALLLSKIVFIIADTIGNIIFPLYTKAKDEDKKIIDKNVYYVSSILFILSLFFLATFYISGNTLLTIMYEDSYKQAYLPSIILIAGTQGMIIYKFLSRKIASENSWKILYQTVFVAAIVNIILNITLIPIYGIVGAALASATAYWLCGILLTVLYKEKISNFLFKFTPVKADN